VLLVIDRLREAHPYLSEDLYDQVEFQANPSLGFRQRRRSCGVFR
jgi:type VI secretion system protein ImpH